jgi:hypothetical protein
MYYQMIEQMTRVGGKSLIQGSAIDCRRQISTPTYIIIELLLEVKLGCCGSNGDGSENGR